MHEMGIISSMLKTIEAVMMELSGKGG